MADIFPNKGLVVTSNELIHAKYHFSLWQKRVFMYFVSLIEKEAVEFGLQKVFIADLVRFFEAEQNGTVADIIEKVPRQLYETSIQVPYRDEEGHERLGEVRLVTKYTKPQDKKEGNAYIELKFNEDLRPHLIDLKKHFSKYELRHIVHLQSAHAIRIYEILKSHQYQKQIDLDVDYLKTILEVDTKYKLYGDFKRKIIDKAQKDLAQHCDIGFSYKEIKSGKKVVTLRFSIFENRAEDKFAAKEGRGAASKSMATGPIDRSSFETDAVRDALFLEIQPTAVGEWGVSPSKLLDLIRLHEPEQIRQALRVTKRKITTSELKNKAGFFIEAVLQNYTDEQELFSKKKAKLAEITTETRARVTRWQEELTLILDAMRGEINTTIRTLVEADERVRTRAIDAVRATKNPILRKEFEKIGEEPTEQHFRENARLREAVVWEITGQNAAAFDEIRVKYAPQVEAILEALVKSTGKREVRFDVRRFLNLH